MARKSRLLQVLRLAEDFLIFFDDYFKSTSWVYHHSGLSRQTKLKSKRYLQQKKILESDFSLNLPERSIYNLIVQPWDEQWRTVSFDISESNRKVRNKIRYNLKKIGFKNLQRSVWVSPLPVDEFVDKIRKRLDNARQLVVFVGRLKGQSSKKLVRRLWDLDEWSNKTNDFIGEIGKNDQSKVEIEKRFWDLILSHPKVPLALLPDKWPLNRLVSTCVREINSDE